MTGLKTKHAEAAQHLYYTLFFYISPEIEYIKS